MNLLNIFVLLFVISFYCGALLFAGVTGLSLSSEQRGIAIVVVSGANFAVVLCCWCWMILPPTEAASTLDNDEDDKVLQHNTRRTVEKGEEEDRRVGGGSRLNDDDGDGDSTTTSAGVSKEEKCTTSNTPAQPRPAELVSTTASSTTRQPAFPYSAAVVRRREHFDSDSDHNSYYRRGGGGAGRAVVSVFTAVASAGGVGAAGDCSIFHCDWYTRRFVVLLVLAWLLWTCALVLIIRLVMYKILKSYNKKAERKHEVSRGSSSIASTEISTAAVNGGGRHHQQQMQQHQLMMMDVNNGHGGGALVPAAQYYDDRVMVDDGGGGGGGLHYVQGGGGGYSETSSFESHEHFERRLQRVKRSRSDRDRAAATRRSTERGIDKRGIKVSEITREEESGLTAKDALTQWARRVTEGYPGVNVRDMTSSWRDGLAFNAILHKYRPDLVNWREIRSRMNTRQRLENAFGVAEREFGVTRLLDPEDVEVQAPDERSMITYISTLYDALPDRPAAEKYDRDINDYRAAAREFVHWVQRATRSMQDRSLPHNANELKQLLNELERFKGSELPTRLREKQHLEQIYLELENLFGDTPLLRAIEEEVTANGLSRSWNELLAATSEREQLVLERMNIQGSAQDAARRLQLEIGATNEKLDTILGRLEETESRTRVTSPRQLKDQFDNIIYDLNLLEAPIEGYFRDVESLKVARNPQANDYYKQVFGLHQRRVAYLERCGVVVGQDGKYTMRSDFLVSEEYYYTRETLFKTAEESIQWVDRKLKELSEMPFVEDLKVLEDNMEKHKLEHRDIMDYRHKVDQCIAHQAKVSAEDSGAYCDLLHTLEEAYAQLRELSTGRVLDLDSLIAFIRAAQMELVWINEREELEVSRNWSDVGQLDLPMLQNYYKQLLHEIELREEQFNAVHNQGAALINQGHPAIYVIEAYLTTMQAQWDWLLSLTQCFEIHLQDAVNTQQFIDDAQNCEQWMEKQTQLISTHYDRGDFSLDEGERILHELEEIREMLDRYHDILLSLIERSRIISPLWQRGERIGRPIPVEALCNYQERNISIRKSDECTLMENTDMIKWSVRTTESVECVVPSVVFRLPPPDERLLGFLQRLQVQFDRLRRLWTEKQRMVRFTMILNTMRTIRGWDLKQFMALDPDQREAIIKALNDDTNKLLAELDPNDPLAARLREELRLTNEHFYQLLQAAQRGPEPELADKFDEKIAALLQTLEEAWRNLNDRVTSPLPRDIDAWEKQIIEHKTFEDSLQALDSDVSMVQELFRQLEDPSPMQRARMDQLSGRWEDLWDLSRMVAERLKALEVVLNGLTEATQIVAEHEITLASFNTLPAKLDELRAVHSQLLEIQLILQQQQPIMDDLATNVGQLRQHVVRTRFNVADHPDVDKLEDEVQRVTVRWENICMQVIERLKAAELSLQNLMIYRAAYESEVTWLDRVEATLGQLRMPETLSPDEYQEQLDILLAEYAHLTERTQAMESVNLEGGKYIRDARVYDIRLSQYKDLLEEVHKGIDSLTRRTQPPPTPGADVVAKELDELNKRFSQLSSIIYQRRNDLQLLMQKYQQKQLNEIAEKYAACGDSIDGLVGKLRKNRQDLVQKIGGIPASSQDQVDGGKNAGVANDYPSSIAIVKENDGYLRSLEDDVKNSLQAAEKLTGLEGAAGLSPEEFHNLRKRSDELKRVYDTDSMRTQIIMNRLTAASKLKEQFDAQAAAFRAWTEQTNVDMDKLLTSAADSSDVTTAQKRCREMSDDVSGHRSELYAITNLAKQIEDETKGYIGQLAPEDGGGDADLTKDVPPLIAVKKEADDLAQSWHGLKERCQLLHHQLEDAKQFFILYSQLKSWLSGKGKLIAVMGPVGSDIQAIDNQMKQIQVLLDEFDNEKPNLDGFLRCGASLASTQSTEECKRSINDKTTDVSDKWNQLIDLLNEKKAALHKGKEDLENAGDHEDSLKHLLSWLSEQEAAVDISPSADPKVLKAQIDAQKFLEKLISEKRPSIENFQKSIDKKIQRAASPAERQELAEQAKSIIDRYENLVNGAEGRREKLHKALELAEQWSDQYPPLASWLENVDKHLQSDYISTDRDRIAAQIEDHKNLHEEIEGQRPLMDNLVELGIQLSGLVADDEREQLQHQLTDLAERYDQLGSKSIQYRANLDKVADGLDAYLTRLDELSVWMDDVTLQSETFESFSSIPDTLENQIKEIAELAKTINDQEQNVLHVIYEGGELCTHARSDEALALQGKLDGLRWRYNELTKTMEKKIATVQEIVPLAGTFDNADKMLGEFLGAVEADLANIDDTTLDEKHVLIANIEDGLKEFRPLLNDMATSSARLSQLCSSDQAELNEGAVARTRKRFEDVEEQVRRKGEQYSRLLDTRDEILDNMNDLIDWFQEAEAKLLSAGAAPAEPTAARAQLQDQKLLHSDVGSERARSHEAINAAKRILKDMAGEEAQAIEDKIEVLKELSETVQQLSANRLSELEQAVPLAEHFHDSHNDLGKWLDVVENELESTPSVVTGLHPDQLRKHLDINKAIQDSIQENKPLLDTVNKSGGALSQLCNDDDANAINDILDQVNSRFENVREQARSRGLVMNDALQRSLEVSDQLDNMLDSLSITADKVRHPEPVAAYPDRIREQVLDNAALMDELEQKHDAYKNIQVAAKDILRKADPSDPAVSEIKGKMDSLDSLWNEILSATELRGQQLDETLTVAQRFWDELRSCERALKTLQQRLDNADPPGCERDSVTGQQADLAQVEAALEKQAPMIDACRETGAQLLQMVGEPEKPELQHHIAGLSSAWETVTDAFHRRNDNLLEAMEQAMHFHGMLNDVLDYLTNAEQRFDQLEPISSNLVELQEQIEEIGAFKNDLDQQSVVVQQLNQQCDHLTEGRTLEQAAVIKRPMQDLNRRWDQLSTGVRQRRDKLDKAYVEAGHFQQALDQVLDWIEQTDKTLDEIKPVPGDLKQIEIEIAKHKVLQNDVHSRQTSVHTLNDAARKLLAAHADADPKGTQQKLDALNTSWAALLEKLAKKGQELENCKGEAASFGDQVQRWLHWLAEVDNALSSSKMVGGLPETTREQLENFMVLYEELHTNQPQIEETIRLGDEFVSKSPENAASTSAQHIKTLKQRWDAMMHKANDRKERLEIAARDAVEFDDLMKQFVEWLVKAEQYLNGLLPVSRLIEGIKSQMEEHGNFREEVNAEREVAVILNEKGTKLKYYCQKQDVILIKNLLVSTGNRWDKVVSRTADRTKQLDHAYKDVRDFHVRWEELSEWCVERVKQLEEASAPGRSNKAEIIKENLNKHKEFQQELGQRQRDYDTAMKLGKQLKDHAPKSEQPEIQRMLDSLREKWSGLCNRSIDRQRELEEDLLFAGQFKEAVDGLMKWMEEMEPLLASDTPVYGDIDTVTGLVDQHHNFTSQLKARQATVDTVRKAGEELLRADENPEIEAQLAELNTRWERVKSLAAEKDARLADAKTVAEKFYQGAHAILEWLAEMETKVKFAGAIPDDEEQLNKQLEQLKNLQGELVTQTPQLDDVLSLGKDILTKCHPDAEQPMKQWLTILQARWDEVVSWAQERDNRLNDQLNELREQDALLDDLLRWLAEKDAYLNDLESEPIPEDLPLVENLIEEHAQFEDALRSRQPDFDEATKGRRRQEPEPAAQGKDTKSKKPRRPVNRGRNPKVQQVTEKFNHVWLMTLDRKRKLDEMLNYLRELRKMQDFNFDDWRRRYTAWMNNKKSRVMDFFRRQDKDGDGKVTREEFIDGILQSKFPTTRLEMNAVADIFDKDRDGYIDYREFINALRPDREATQPKNDSQKIKSEVQRQAQMCTCRKKYEIQEVGEGRYKFGEQLRLVRILRSTVMVRVGGGWVALDEFLVKNDPCRAKGRTNIELREKFILAEGVSQTMLPFKSKNPRTPGTHASSSSDSSKSAHHHHFHSTPGPIMKVREKTERSMPMTKTTPRSAAMSPHQNGTGAGGGGSSADSEVSGILNSSRRSSGDLLSPVTPKSTTSRHHNGTPTSRPSSGKGATNIPVPVAGASSSRPPSRAGSDISDVSLRSHDSLGPVTPSRIPSTRKKHSSKQQH